MPADLRPHQSPYYRIVALLILAAGVAGAIASFRAGRQEERERAEADFNRRAIVRHALTREVLGRYEDSLYGLSTLFSDSDEVTRREFSRASHRLEERLGGVQAFEWVPLVAHDRRAATETALTRAYAGRTFEFTQFDANRQRVRAAERPVYFPIAYVQPLAGNEAALGYDLMTGPTLPFLERARATRQMQVTSQIRLVQEKSDQNGVVMIWPVYRVSRTALLPLTRPGETEVPQPAEEFFGFLQCVFRVHDLLESASAPQADTILDMLFVDTSETDPARRVLFYRPADPAAPRTPVPTETEFRRETSCEHAIPFGQRHWRVAYRPRADWFANQRTAMPFLRSGSLLMLSVLLAGLVHVIGRQTQTVRRQVEERTAELAESRRQLATLLHALPGMAFRCTYDDQINVQFASDGVRGLTGWSADEFTSGAAHFRDLIHPDDLSRVRDVTRRALQQHIDVEVEYRIRPRDGGEKWVLSRGRGVYTEDGRLNIFEGLAIDITAQKRAEQERLAMERKLLEGQKLESLGLLAGGIAHDFNNLLTGILGNANLARLTLPPSSGVEHELRAIETAALRAADLCRQMLAYAGKGRFVIEPTDLTTLTEDLLPLLRVSIGHQAQLDLQLAHGLPAVMIDTTQLRQIVMNLVLNSADAIGERGGTITLTTGLMTADAALLARCVTGTSLPPGDFVFLEVRDTGAGMTPEVLAKIFDPFFTTKFAGRGLGLAAALGIVRGHQGALQVESTPGRGSAFRLLLPPAKGATAALKSSDSSPPMRWRHSGRVLVIEDEEHVRTVTVAVLQTFGLTVRSAADGASGVALFREDPAAVDLVILDLLMPGLSGEQTLAALRAIEPGIRVLLMSGYSEGDLLRRLGGGGPLVFLSKPFTRASLEAKLRELLGDLPAS